jgi:hypothetical protein
MILKRYKFKVNLNGNSDGRYREKLCTVDGYNKISGTIYKSFIPIYIYKHKQLHLSLTYSIKQINIKLITKVNFHPIKAKCTTTQSKTDSPPKPNSATGIKKPNSRTTSLKSISIRKTLVKISVSILSPNSPFPINPYFCCHL